MMGEKDEEGWTGRRDENRTRAIFKKGSKCVIPVLEKDEATGAEKVVYYGGMVMKGEKTVDEATGEPTYKYHVHYLNFSKEYDDWYAEADLMRWDPALVGIPTKAKGETDAARRRAEIERRAAEAAALADVPPALRLRLPVVLKKVAVDEWEAVAAKGGALPLPRPAHGRPSVAAVLDEWLAAARGAAAEGGADAGAAAEVAARLREYFDAGCRQLLLFACEVPAHDAAVAAPGAPPPSGLYGAEHLVRLLVALPGLVPVVLMASHGDARHVLEVERQLGSLMAWMVELPNQARLFAAADEYRPNPHWTGPPSSAQAALHAGGGAAGSAGHGAEGGGDGGGPDDDDDDDDEDEDDDGGGGGGGGGGSVKEEGA